MFYTVIFNHVEGDVKVHAGGGLLDRGWTVGQSYTDKDEAEARAEEKRDFYRLMAQRKAEYLAKQNSA
jgi:hypothetical protein